MEIQHTRNLVSGLMLHPILSSVFTDRFTEDEIPNLSTSQVIEAIYDSSVLCKDTWMMIKPYFIGSEHIFGILSPRSRHPEWLLPTFYARSKRQPFKDQTNNIPEKFVLAGDAGEMVVADIFNYIIRGPHILQTCGKLCLPLNPMLSATPDFLVVPRPAESRAIVAHYSSLENMNAIGVCEVKTHVIDKPKSAVDYYGLPLNAATWMRETRSAGQFDEFRRQCARTTWVTKSVHDAALAAKVRWTLVGGSHPEGNKYAVRTLNNTGGVTLKINLFGGLVGRQVLAEMLVLRAYMAPGEMHVGATIAFVNLTQDLEFHSCIYATFRLSVDLLDTIAMDLTMRFNENFKDEEMRLTPIEL